MKLKSLLLFGLFLNVSIYAQQYPAVEFENYNPLWTRTSITEKIPLKVQWYWLEQNHGNAFLTIHNKILYNVYNIFNDWINGYYLEAIDLANGNLLWDYSFYGTGKIRRRYAQHPVFHGDSMELMIFEENDSSENPFYPIWASAHAGKIIFNKNNGLVLDSSFQTTQDPQTKTLVLPFTPFNNNFSTHLYSRNSGYNYIKNTGLINSASGENFVNYEKYLLDKNGRQIDSLNLRILAKYQVIYNAIVDVDDENLFCIYYSENVIDSIKKSELAFHYMDKELNVLNSGTLNQVFLEGNNQSSVILSASKYIIVRSDSIINKSEANLNFLSLFDNKGNIIENLDLRHLKLRAQNADFISAVVINENNKFKVLFCVNSAISNTLTFYKSNGLGHIFEVKKMRIKADTKNSIVIRRMQVVGKNLLCLFNYYETLTNVDPLPLWNGWVMINGEDLGIMTKNNDERLDQEKILKISPNPTSDILTIEFDKVISGNLYIYNEIGHLIRSEDLYNVKEYNYNVSELLDGKYHIQFINDNKIFNAQFIKVK